MCFRIENGDAYYVNMLSITESDLGLRVLGCSDGTAAFNSELTIKLCRKTKVRLDEDVGLR